MGNMKIRMLTQAWIFFDLFFPVLNIFEIFSLGILKMKESSFKTYKKQNKKEKGNL